MSEIYVAVSDNNTSEYYLAKGDDDTGEIYLATGNSDEPPEQPPHNVVTYQGDPVYHSGEWVTHD